MKQPTIEFEDATTQQELQAWADDQGFIALESISLHLEELFDVGHIIIHEVKENDDFISLKIRTDKWPGLREFALMSTGAIAW